MSRHTLIALLLGLLLVAAPAVSRAEDEYGEEEEEEAPASADDEKDVVVLTAANFEDTIKGHKFVLAEFYAPWCGHCKNLAPHYAKAATALKSHDADVVLGKVDATVESDLASKFGVSGYPTLKWFVDGEPVDYNGPREADGIVGWVKKKTGPPTRVIDDEAALKALEADSPAIVVAYKLEGDALTTLKAVAQKAEDVTFVETSSAAVAKLAGLTKAGSVGIIKNFKGEERGTAVYSGEVTVDDFGTWVKGEKIPLTLEFNEGNSDKIFNSGINKQLLLWSDASDLAAGAKLMELFKKVSSAFKGKLVFVTVDNSGTTHEPVTNFFGLKEAKGPVLLGFWMEKNRKYQLKGELTEEAVKEFAQGVVDGTAPVEYKSGPIPENNKDGDVTVVVGKTVEQIVFDETKDVLLEVYAPWCGHCKSLEPVYKKLAKRFKKVESVVIAKMDGTENEHPELEVKGFPTLFFVPAGTREVVPFEENDRSLKSLTKFIKKHAKVEYELPKKDAKDEEGAKEDAKDEL